MDCQGEKGHCIETGFYLPIFENARYTVDELQIKSPEFPRL